MEGSVLAFNAKIRGKGPGGDNTRTDLEMEIGKLWTQPCWLRIGGSRIKGSKRLEVVFLGVL